MPRATPIDPLGGREHPRRSQLRSLQEPGRASHSADAGAPLDVSSRREATPMRIPSLLAAAILVGGGAAAPAAAAPQVLGVVASIAPVEMSCTGETCTAQLSAFCLQREREVPGEHTAYRAADPSAYTLVAR